MSLQGTYFNWERKERWKEGGMDGRTDGQKDGKTKKQKTSPLILFFGKVWDNYCDVFVLMPIIVDVSGLSVNYC